jgi:LuxR family transcriptional regulator, maltose regulon positive regulatory protein
MENYTQHITRTRIAIPRKRTDLISRQRLLDALDELLDKKVIIIAAPAGYGKTSLLIDLADDLALPVCWYSLDVLDQNISRFLEYFVASIQIKFPDFKTNIINVLHSSYQKEVDVDAMVTILVNDIYDQITEHFIIMLDDYHLVVEDTQINQFLSRFLQNVEENCHIVFASRTLLALPDLPLMVARGLVGGLGFEELAFTTGETRELFFNNHHIVLSDTEAETLCKQTEGWITGLLLTAQTSITRLQAHEKSLRATGVNINDYFELIYNAQPEQIQQFLLYTSLLEDFDFDSFNKTVGKLFPDLCRQYKTCADHIFKANLFVQSVGLDGLSLRYHHLFLDYLQQKVRLEQAETYEKLQDIIATHYRETQQWEKAYEIYRKEGQLEKQIALLEEEGASMMFAGNAPLLQKWLTSIDSNLMLSNPNLCSLMGTILGAKGDLPNSLKYLNHALEQIDSLEDPALASRTLTRKATTLRSMGNYGEALQFAQKSLDIIGDNISLRSIRAETYRIMGTSYAEIGNPVKSLEVLELALSDFSYLSLENEIAITTFNIGTSYFMLSEYGLAKKHFLNNIAYWEKNGNHIWLGPVLNNLGVLQHSSGEIEDAVMNLEKALHYCEITNEKRLEAIVLNGIGDIYTDLNAYTEAIKIYNQSVDISISINSKYIHVYALNGIAQTYIYQNDLKKAQEYIDKASSFLPELNSETDEKMLIYSQGLIHYYKNDYQNALKNFLIGLDFSITNKYKLLLGKNCMYTMLCYMHLDRLEEIEELSNTLKDNLTIPENQFSLLTIGNREIKNIKRMINNFSYLGFLNSWLNLVNSYQNDIPKFRRRIRRKTTLVTFAPAVLEIFSLNEVKVKSNNIWLSSSDWQTQSARDLFFLLLSKPNGLTKEEIGVILWPEDSEQELKFHFKNAIYRVRRAISKDCILLDGDRYLFNRNLDFRFDVEDFRREVKNIHLANNWDEKLRHYKRIIEIYKGPYLPNMDASWIIRKRNELATLFLNTLHEISKEAFKNELFEFCIEISLKILEQEPCNEEAFRISMRSQSAIGNKMEVERLFKLCEKRLMEELEAPPSQKTRKLYHTLMKI